jgi:AcrR family transcriptional regulator
VGTAKDTGAAPVRRRDAVANRERILAAAAEAFGRDGLGVSMVEIARRAGVGNATVHRNYPCKQLLLDELFDEWFARRRAAAAAALADPDPWAGLSGFIEDAFADASAHRAAGDLYAVRMRGRERLRSALDRLVRRAQADGSMRSDVTTEDVMLLMLGVGRTIEVTAGCDDQQWRRHLGVVLHGLRAPGGPPLAGRPLSAAALDRAVEAWAEPLVGRRP